MHVQIWLFLKYNGLENVMKKISEILLFSLLSFIFMRFSIFSSSPAGLLTKSCFKILCLKKDRQS